MMTDLIPRVQAALENLDRDTSHPEQQMPSCKIVLTKGQVAIVDAEDYQWLSKWNWRAEGRDNHFCASRGQRNGKHMAHVYMHREIMKAKAGEYIDHINHDTLDNRKVNLRLCTHKQNCRNRRSYKRMKKDSLFKGVCFDHRINKWTAHIYPTRIGYYLGSFDTEEEAAIVYNVAAQLFYGEFACLNPV